MHGRPAVRAEVVSRRLAAVGRTGPAAGATLDPHALCRPARLSGEHAPGPLLASEAVAYGNSHRLALGDRRQLPASAGGETLGHARISIGVPSGTAR